MITEAKFNQKMARITDEENGKGLQDMNISEKEQVRIKEKYAS